MRFVCNFLGIAAVVLFCVAFPAGWVAWALGANGNVPALTIITCLMQGAIFLGIAMVGTKEIEDRDRRRRLASIPPQTQPVGGGGAFAGGGGSGPGGFSGTSGTNGRSNLSNDGRW